MATNKQMQLLRFFPLSLLAFVSVHCNDSDSAFGHAADSNAAVHEQTATAFYHDESITLTDVHIRANGMMIKRQKPAKAVHGTHSFPIEASSEGIVGGFSVEYEKVPRDIESRTPFFELLHKPEPHEIPKGAEPGAGSEGVANTNDSCTPDKHIAADAYDLQYGEPETDLGNTYFHSAGEYLSGTADVPLIFASHLTDTVQIVYVFIREGQRIKTSQVLMTGIRIKNGAPVVLFAPHDGEVLRVNAVQGQKYDAGFVPYVMSVDLPEPLPPRSMSVRKACLAGSRQRKILQSLHQPERGFKNVVVMRATDQNKHTNNCIHTTAKRHDKVSVPSLVPDRSTSLMGESHRDGPTCTQ